MSNIGKKLTVIWLLLILVSFIPVNAQEIETFLPLGVETYLINDFSDYKKYGLDHIKNLPEYNTESLTDFHMPIVYMIPSSAKMDINKFIKQGMFLNSNKNFTDRLLDSGYNIYGDFISDKYFVVDYWIKIKASDKPFSIDFIPKIELDNKNYNLNQYAWWNSSWNYVKYAEVCNNITDYTINLTVGYNSGGDVHCSGHCQNDFEDIRFTKNDNTTELHYWIESCTSGVSAVFWVNVSDVDSICMYYGNNNASNSSNGDDTFLFWEGDGASANNWVHQGSNGTVTDSGAWLKFDSLSTIPDEFELQSAYVYNHTSNFIIETDYKKHDTAGDTNMMLFPDDGTTPFDDDWTSLYFCYNRKIANLGFWCYGDSYCRWSNTLGDLQIYDIQVHVNLTNDKSDFWLDSVQKTDIYGTSGKWCILREPNEISNLNGLYVTIDDKDDLYFRHLRTRLWTLGTEPSFCNWSIEHEPPTPSCECLVTNPNPANNSIDVSLFFNNVTVAINSSCGIFEWVNISFLNCSHNVSTSLTNGTYYLNISGCSNLKQLTNYTWYVNASCNGTINCFYFYFITVSSGCECIDELTDIYNKLIDIENILEGDDVIEINEVQFVIIVHLFLLCIFLWIGYTIPAMEGHKKSLHYMPFSGGLFIIFAGFDFISMSVLLTYNYELGIVGGFLTTVGIILLFYGILKAFYYELE